MNKWLRRFLDAMGLLGYLGIVTGFVIGIWSSDAVKGGLATRVGLTGLVVLVAAWILYVLLDAPEEKR